MTRALRISGWPSLDSLIGIISTLNIALLWSTGNNFIKNIYIMEYYAETNKKQERSQWTAIIVKEQKNVYTKKKRMYTLCHLLYKKNNIYNTHKHIHFC